MKIIIDSAIPFVKGIFEPYCSVEYLAGNEFTSDKVADASALLIRTRTRCNRELLEGSQVRHIATATIGFDHIDIDYCHNANIEVSTAAGCNARAVLQWVGATLVQISRKEGWAPNSKVLGIVGVGHVGSLIRHYAHSWGFEVICCDPPRMEREGGDFISFEELAQRADIITLHTPLDATTKHLINSNILAKIGSKTLILNSSRGEVIKTEALLQSGNPFALDVWEHEPNLNDEALDRALIATPHIAGYSLQGKANATTMAVRSIAKSLSLPLTDWCSEIKPTKAAEISWQELCETVDQRFDIATQSEYLKAHKGEFEELRNNYNYREEYF